MASPQGHHQTFKIPYHPLHMSHGQKGFNLISTKWKIYFWSGKGAKIKKSGPGTTLPLTPPPQHYVVPLLCFLPIFIEKPSSKVVPLIIFAVPPAP